jgi:hypothetical protein
VKGLDVNRKWIGTWDGRLLRLFRLTWTRGTVGDGRGYSAKLTLALTPAFFALRRGYCDLAVTLLGFRVHYQRAYGGIWA